MRHSQTSRRTDHPTLRIADAATSGLRRYRCTFRPRWGLVVFTLIASLASTTPAEARVRLENICTIYGQREIKLTGIGLVVGLNGSGDGGKSLPAVRALASALKLMNTPAALEELRDAKNVAIVLVEATVPKTGLRRGQKIDCYVSSFMGAKSLRGGRMLVSPVETSEVGNDRVMGLCSGPIYIESADVPTTGKIPGGIVLEDDIISNYIRHDAEKGPLVTLLLDGAHASFHAASEVARTVNDEFRYEAGNQEVAQALGPGVIEVKLPTAYANAPVDFVAQILEVGIDEPHTQAKVVVNPKTGTVIVTGDVEISPVVISHRNLTVAIGGPDAAPLGPGRVTSIPRIDVQNPQSAPPNLRQLVQALDQLRVPTEDVIDILRELHRSGKLHAEFDEY